MRIKDFILIPIMLLILVSTAWSVYRSSERTPQATQVTAVEPDNFFNNLYKERLKEEGDRASRVEKMIKEGKLSDKPARYTSGSADLPPLAPPYKGGGKEMP